MQTYYIFLVVFTFFFQVAAVSLLDVLGSYDLDTTPQEMINLIAAGIPDKGMFYLHYFLNQIFIAYALVYLIRIFPFLITIPSRLCGKPQTSNDVGFFFKLTSRY